MTLAFTAGRARSSVTRLAIDGIQVRLTDVSLIWIGCRVGLWVDVDVSWDGGTTWSLVVRTDSLTTGADDDRSVGSDLSLSMWGSHAWTRDDLSNANFRIRLTWRDGTPSCSANQALRVDRPKSGSTTGQR